jgi:lipopolysaccharide/colanic/teichoic acid biosynthesis glycosyltransferase
MTRQAIRKPAIGPTRLQLGIKRLLDIVGAAVGLVLVGWVIALAALAARRSTGGSGIFRQSRIGRDGHVFEILKIRTMRNEEGIATTVTTAHDCRITRLGAVLRRWKIDELPQLWNVLRGEMSFVGPRPEVPSYLEQIRSEAPAVLSVRPGITGPASIKYRHEELILAVQPDPQTFNDLILFPDKLRLNTAYVKKYRVTADLVILWKTIFHFGSHDDSNRITTNAA